MHDDSFNEIDQFTHNIQEYDPKMIPEGMKDFRGPSMDSEDSYFNKLQQHLTPNVPTKQQLKDKYNSPEGSKERLANSQSAVQFQNEHNIISQADLCGRKMTKDMREQLYSDHHSHLNPNSRFQEEGASILEMDYSLLDPEEPLIIDKGIMKFHPGFSINYVSRWVQVTKTVIRFYKNYYHSVCNFRRPLAVIPFSAIQKIRSIKLPAPKGNTARKNVYDSNQFEFVLNEEYEAIYDLNKRKKEVEELKHELDLIQKLEYQNKLRRKYKRYRIKCRLSKSPVPTFKIFMEDRREDIGKLSRSNPRLSFSSRFNEDDLSRYETLMNKSHDILHPDTSTFGKGRAKEMMASGDKSMISIEDQFIHKSCSRSKSRKRGEMMFNSGGLSNKVSPVKR